HLRSHTSSILMYVFSVQPPPTLPPLSLTLPPSRHSFPYTTLFPSRAMNRLEKLFIIKRLNQKSDRADLHREDPRGGIFVSCNHDDMSLPRYSAQSRQNFQAGHSFHPNVQHH